PRGEKSFAGGLRGSFLLASLLAAACALASAVMSAAPRTQPVEREGRLNIVVEDDFDTPRARTVYRLETDEGENLELEFGAGQPDRSFKSGVRVHVIGRSDGETLWVEQAERIGSPRALGAEQTTIWTTGPKKILLIRFNFHDDTSQPYTDATSNNVMFGAS